ncbi:MAG: hypothetical protein KBT00_08530 [Bacteroidales bacterium]|nr:hypothetical protein [Candidatus Cacconaster merdequi]
MVRGKAWFKCPCCGRVFKAMDIEVAATSATMPMPCPDCGTKSPVISSLGLLELLIRKFVKRRTQLP